MKPEMPPTINALGIATSDIAEMGLREISRTVMQAQRDQFFANREKSRYLEFNGQIVTFEVQNTSVATGVSIKKTGPVQAVPGPVSYTHLDVYKRQVRGPVQNGRGA